MPKPHNKLVYYSIEDDKNTVFESLPDFLKEMCETCEEWKAAGGSTSDEPPFDADASTDTEDF